MERLAVEIGLIIIAIGMGYWMGFHACFDYLMQELEDHKQKQTRMGKET